MPIAGDQTFRSTALQAKALVKGASNGRLIGFSVSNLDAAVAWLTFWDAAQTADVTVGTTAPLASFHVASSGDKDISFDHPGIGFNLGLVAAVTTTDGGATLATTGLAATVVYE